MTDRARKIEAAERTALRHWLRSHGAAHLADDGSTPSANDRMMRHVVNLAGVATLNDIIGTAHDIVRADLGLTILWDCDSGLPPGGRMSKLIEKATGDDRWTSPGTA